MIAALVFVLAQAEGAQPVDVDLDPRKRLTPEDYARKNEGWYLTGLPLAAYDPNFGFGGGARVYFYQNGARSDALFPYTAYMHRAFLQFFASTGGLQFHWLDYDAPYIFGTSYRLRAQLIYERNLARNYFGVGARSLGALVSPRDNVRYDTMAELQESLDRNDAGSTYARYNQVDVERPTLFLSAERTFLSGTLRPLVGFTFSHATIDPYDGERIEVDGVQAVMRESRLTRDCQAGTVSGCAGGWDNVLRLALSFDTRDFEPDPNNGVFIDLALDLGTGALGSDYDYLRTLLAARVYWSPAPELTDLVLALRGLIQVQDADTPFSSMNLLPFTEDPRAGLGGVRTMRGHKQDRFIGPVMTAVTLEARWTFLHFGLLGQKFGLIAVLFGDAGRPFDELATVSYRRWQPAYGGALRIAWNQATIIMIDYARSSEDSGLYVNFTHIF